MMDAMQAKLVTPQGTTAKMREAKREARTRIDNSDLRALLQLAIKAAT